MKRWTSAETDGRCSYDARHGWTAGTRIFRVQGGTWKKDFCADCATARHEAPPDTGELLEVTDAVNYPAPLREQAMSAFDAKAAAANDRE